MGRGSGFAAATGTNEAWPDCRTPRVRRFKEIGEEELTR
jgi:hypothetical protein